jgi:hypothetical protein
MKAQNDDKIDQLLFFIEEFAKRLRTETRKETYNVIRDVAAFNDLPEVLQKELNVVLNPFGIQY